VKKDLSFFLCHFMKKEGVLFIHINFPLMVLPQIQKVNRDCVCTLNAKNYEFHSLLTGLLKKNSDKCTHRLVDQSGLFLLYHQ